MSDTELFSLRLSGTGLSIDQKIPKELATRIVQLLFSNGSGDGEGAGGSSERQRGPASDPKRTSAPGVATSLREYVNQHKAKKITQQIVAIGSYRQARGGKNFFTREELNTGFEDAILQPPGNPTRDIARTISLGWIAPKSGQKNHFYVTGTGESALDANFAGHNGGGPGVRRRGKRRKKAAKKGPSKGATR